MRNTLITTGTKNRGRPMPLVVIFYLTASSGVVYLWEKLTFNHKAIRE